MAAKKSGTVRVFLVMGAVTAITLFFVWTRLQNIRLRRELVRLKEREQEVTLESNRLKVEWAKLTSPKRLEELGAQKYNLKRPNPEQVIVARETK
jgi:cell division protein FtsL